MAVIDSSDKVVLQANGSGATFTDTSLSPKTITANGNATQVQRKINNTAAFFDGTGDYIVVPDHADWDLGDFTFETFVMFSTTAGSQTIICRDADVTQFMVRRDAGNLSVFIAGTEYTDAWSINAMQWYHVAVSRSGSSVRFFIDGVQLGATRTNSTAISSTSLLMIGGRVTGATHYLSGWMKELRISNSARYTAGFTPTTTQFSSDANTKLLLHFDTPATAVLGPVIAFDGSGDYLTAPDSADWDIASSGAYTAEGWFMWKTVGDQYLIGQQDHSALSGGGWCILYNGSALVVDIQNSGVLSYSWTPIAYRWYHIAFVRSTTTAFLYVDGKQVATAANTAATSSSNALHIGRQPSTGGKDFNGFMKMIRVSNTNRYTAAFTPSQTAFADDANTKLLLLAAENNGVTTFTDSEATPKTITTNGNTKIEYWEDYRNTIFKDDGNTGHTPYGTTAGNQKVDFVAAFGAASAYFDGTGDTVSAADHADWRLGGGAGAFTVEAWIKMNTVTSNMGIITQRVDASNQWRLGLSGTTSLQFAHVTGGSTTLDVTGTFNPIANTWYHVAVTRNGNNFKLWVNGTQVGSTMVSANSVVDFAAVLSIGTGAGIDYNGFIDNARIANVSRYDATFNPDTVDIDLSTKGNMLLCF